MRVISPARASAVRRRYFPVVEWILYMVKLREYREGAGAVAVAPHRISGPSTEDTRHDRTAPLSHTRTIAHVAPRRTATRPDPAATRKMKGA